MGVLASAAFDPVFFAHHANIDWIWDKWEKADLHHTNPTNPIWLQQGFFFYDQAPNWTYISNDQIDPHPGADDGANDHTAARQREAHRLILAGGGSADSHPAHRRRRNSRRPRRAGQRIPQPPRRHRCVRTGRSRLCGTIAVVASQAPGGVGHKHPVIRNFSFDITGKLAASLGSDNNVAVTLVPATGTGKKPSAVNLSHRRVYIATRQ